LSQDITASRFDAKKLCGSIHRVVLNNQPIFVDGALLGEPSGKNLGTRVRISSVVSPGVAIASNRRSVSPARPRFPSLEVTSATTRTKLFNDTNEETAGDISTKSSAKYISHLPRSIEHTQDAPFYKKNIVSVKDFDRKQLHFLFGVAQEMRSLVEKHGQINLLQGKVMCSAFWEPSTRTSCSFETAMTRLGGGVVSINQITSSIAKGESLGDTGKSFFNSVRTLGSYGDVIVMRHPEKNSVATAAKFSPVPIINAGDGTGEHPTQAFLDIFTIREELGTCSNLTVTLVGDLKNGRTVHSLVKLLSLYGVKLNYISPPSLRMPEEVKNTIQKAGCSQYESADLAEVIPDTDVLYVTRVQKERFSSLEEYEKVANNYVISPKTLVTAKSNMIIMHPLPRINEIDPEVDFDQRAAYFRQMKYGLYVRMALLALILGRSQ
jgi:carbamoyl-phosphate synthase/aspartate carbamoyltransferase